MATATDAKGHITVVLHGLHGQKIAGTAYASAVPAFAQLSDAEIAAIVNHERTSWGNHAPTVAASAVTHAR